MEHHIMEIRNKISNMKDIKKKVEVINKIKTMLHEISPFCNEPVDCVIWVPKDDVAANDYNPNTVASPEMKLLELSINKDGYTQPIVAMQEDGKYTVIDGFHRNRVGKECKTVTERLKGFLPVTLIKDECKEKPDRISSTIRHNRARGVHQVGAMSEIVVDLAKRNWNDKKIAKELGMEPDEVLRLKQISGLAEIFADKEFSEAWEV